MTLLADYQDERAAFNALLEPDCRQRILLLRGESGIGKTTLVQACLDEMPRGMPCICIQLLRSAVSVAEIFYRGGDRLGWEHLPNFTAQVAELQGTPRIQVDSNWLTGINNRINVALHAETPSDQESRQAILTGAWFDDLKRLPAPILLALDIYEQATQQVADWISGPLLARVAEGGALRVLVAGQKVPDDKNIEWGNCCMLRELPGVREAKHWLPVVDALGRQIPGEPLAWLAGVCYALKGRPSEIRKVIESLPPRGEG